MAEKVTLQSRITTFMVILTIVLIAAFTAIQVYNQLNTITIHNQFRARLGTIIAKNNLEAAIQVSQEQDKQTEYLKRTIKSLAESQVIDGIDIYDSKCKIVTSSDLTKLRKATLRDDVVCINDSLKATERQRWFIPKTEKRFLSIYVPLSDKGIYSYVAKLTFSLGNMFDALRGVYVPVIFTTLVVIGLNAGLGYFLSRIIIGPLNVLDKATLVIAGGDLDHRVDLKTGDELQALADRFNQMTVALIKMKERAENANPLTKLPGNIVIREETEKRIQQKQKFVVIYCDLDNFKAFNDKYGIEKGDEAIKLTADVFKEAAKEEGNPEDFIGHEGGDDFILLTTPDKAQYIADYITKEFDKKVIKLYNEEDRLKGYIEAKSRQGIFMKFPIMSISLAGVTNQYRTITSYAEVTNIAAEVKKKAKAIEGSVFVLDKRTDEDLRKEKEDLGR